MCCLHTDGQLFSVGLSVGASVQAGMCIARGETVRDTKGTRRSLRRGVADHRRLVARPRATHIPACTLAPSPAGGGLRLGRKKLGPRLHVDRFRILNLPAQFFRGFEGFEKGFR